MSQRPRILIFTGDGKGKTTAALGMAFRAAGHGLRSCIVQFVKDDPSTGEVAAAAEHPLIEIHQVGRGYLPPPESPLAAEHRQAAEAGLRMAAQVLAEGRVPLVILDEICFAVARGLLDQEQVIDAIGRASPESCIVLTGRDATEGLLALADTVTEMRSVKHGARAGIAAQKGVEW